MIRCLCIIILAFLLTLGATENGAWCSGAGSSAGPERIRIALIHLDSRPGEIERNRRNIETAINRAVAEQADWVLTPELAETGYGFAKRIGTEWIKNFPSAWIRRLSTIAAQKGVNLFIGIAEKDGATGNLHNSIAMIDRHGVIQGTYRKHRVVNGPAESWAVRGIENNLFIADGVPVGLLICADAYKSELSNRYKLMGARILLSPANWPPAGEMGPKGYWEERSRETGLPLIVNNRTGVEPDLDFSAGESAAIANGKRLYTFVSATSQLVLLDWNRAAGTITPAGTVSLDTTLTHKK